MKAGRFHSRDTGDFGNRSEGDVGEFNLEHSNVLSYQVRNFKIETSFMFTDWRL